MMTIYDLSTLLLDQDINKVCDSKIHLVGNVLSKWIEQGKTCLTWKIFYKLTPFFQGKFQWEIQVGFHQFHHQQRIAGYPIYLTVSDR